MKNNRKRVAAILACRVGSKRLFGKPMQLVGKYSILYLIIKQIKKELGIKNTTVCVLFTIGYSKEKLRYLIPPDVILLTKGVGVTNRKNILNVSGYVEGQNLVSIADLVICKCGYSIISECLTNGTPFYFISDPSHKEQEAISKGLKRLGNGSPLTLDELTHLKLTKQNISSYTKFPKIKNETKNATSLILEFLRT